MKKISVALIEKKEGGGSLVRQILRREPLFEFVGVGRFAGACSFLNRVKADVILLDVDPVGDDLPAVIGRLTAAYFPIVWLLVSVSSLPASLCASNVVTAIKPKSVLDPDFSDKGRVIIERIKKAVDADALVEPENNGRSFFEVVAIGGSLGGPQALKTILSALPPDLAVPFFVVQHISVGFTSELVKWLANYSSLELKVAEHLERPSKNRVYFAPDKCHMIINKEKKIALLPGEKDCIVLPSVSELFKSVADVYGDKAIGVLLTGMGSDGAEELLLLSARGAPTIAQDGQSSLMFGMPKRAIELGAARYILPLDRIAAKLVELLKNR